MSQILHLGFTFYFMTKKGKHRKFQCVLLIIEENVHVKNC